MTLASLFAQARIGFDAVSGSRCAVFTARFAAGALVKQFIGQQQGRHQKKAGLPRLAMLTDEPLKLFTNVGCERHQASFVALFTAHGVRTPVELQ